MAPDVAYASIDHEPFAAASTAQVHRATLHDGTEVAVKVQRPEILAKTKADLGVMQELTKFADRRFAFARAVDVNGIVDGVRLGVLRELDYRNEAYNAKRLQEGMAKFPNVGVPNVFGGLSGERVLTMEFVKGIKISDVAKLEAAGLDRQALGVAFIRALIKQVLIDGFFHGDPHPGNLFVVPGTGKVVFIDCGLVGELDMQQRTDLLDLIYSLKTNDFESVATVIIRLSKRRPPSTRRRSGPPSIACSASTSSTARTPTSAARSGRCSPPSTGTGCASTRTSRWRSRRSCRRRRRRRSSPRTSTSPTPRSARRGTPSWLGSTSTT